MKTNEQIKVKLKSFCARHGEIGKREFEAPLILTSTPGLRLRWVVCFMLRAFYSKEIVIGATE